MNLRVTEIFYSLQGETRTSGLPCAFVRLTGCPLRCTWCDTDYSFKGGSLMSLDAIVEKVKSYNPKYVTITGGEPLAQKNCNPLLSMLADQSYEVSLETSGAISLEGVDPRIIKVMDLKPPGSNESHKNKYENINLLTKQDQIKFVIADRTDYEWSVSKLITYQLDTRVSDVLFSPVADVLDGKILANWIIADNLPVRLQLQLHKILWGNTKGV